MKLLIQEIQKQAEEFVVLLCEIPEKSMKKKIIPFTWNDISAQDLLAYQIGWGRLLLNWYHQGIGGKEVVMPGEGFTKWDYRGLAEHFFKKYETVTSQDFLDLTQEIIEVVKAETIKGRLTSEGVFFWCILPSGKQWPLEKWIRVNTCAPYKRAISLLKKHKGIMIE